MKNLFKILILSIISSTIILCNQSVEYYETGDIREIKSYKEIKNKLQVVKIKRYYKNGQLKEEENYRNEKLDGHGYSYCENGNLSESGFYKNGLINGEWKYFRCDGTLYGKGRFLNGENTNISESSGIPLDGRTGVWKFYYEDGEKILFYQTHRNGTFDGLFKSYSQSGKEISSGYYKNDKKWKGSFLSPSLSPSLDLIENVTSIDFYQNGQIMEDESMKTFLKGYWKRIQMSRFGYDYEDSDDYYSLYYVFNDTSLIFYSFRKNEFDEGYTLINHSISDINYYSNRIFKNVGEVILGFEGFYSDGITWKEVIEDGDKEFPVIHYSDDKIKIIYSTEDYEIYLRLDENNLPMELDQVLNN